MIERERQGYIGYELWEFLLPQMICAGSEKEMDDIFCALQEGGNFLYDLFVMPICTVNTRLEYHRRRGAVYGSEQQIKNPVYP